MLPLDVLGLQGLEGEEYQAALDLEACYGVADRGVAKGGV